MPTWYNRRRKLNILFCICCLCMFCFVFFLSSQCFLLTFRILTEYMKSSGTYVAYVSFSGLCNVFLSFQFNPSILFLSFFFFLLLCFFLSLFLFYCPLLPTFFLSSCKTFVFFRPFFAYLPFICTSTDRHACIA